LRQIHPGLIEKGQGVGVAFGLEWAAVALQRGHAGCGGSVNLVVLAATAARELPDPGGRGRRHVDDRFTTGQQPGRQVPAEAFSVLHRPPALLELPRPVQHPAVLGEAGLDADRGDRAVRLRVYRRCRVGALVRVDTYDHSRGRLPFTLPVGVSRD
jgi:hypothetical protein